MRGQSHGTLTFASQDVWNSSPSTPLPEFGATGVQSGDDATGDTMQPAMRPGTQHQHDFSRRVAEKHQVGNAKRFTTITIAAERTQVKELRCHAPATAKSIANVLYVNTFRSVWYSSTRVTRNRDRGIRNCWQYPGPGTIGCIHRLHALQGLCKIAIQSHDPHTPNQGCQKIVGWSAKRHHRNWSPRCSQFKSARMSPSKLQERNGNGF